MFFRRKNSDARRGRRGLNTRMGGDAAGEGRVGFFVKAGFLLSMAALSIFLANALLHFYYFGGSLFGHDFETPRVESIDIVGGETINADLLRDLLELNEGMPLFDSSCGFCGDDLLLKRNRLIGAPTLATVTFTRTMTNSIHVAVTERVPIARIEDRNMAIDRNGIVFICNRGLERLPSLTGIPEDKLAPGMNLLKEIRMLPAAIECLECLAEGASVLTTSMLLRLDVSRWNYLDCMLANRKTLKLAWKYMGTGNKKGRAHLVNQLNYSVDAIGSPRSKGASRFDATIEGRCFAL